MKLLVTALALLVSCIVAPAQIIHTIAGIGGMGGYTGDGGPASAAEFQNPNSMVLDTGGNLYIADGDYNVIRKVDLLGIITTIAGNGLRGYGGDGGPATDAMLNSPTGLTVDNYGNIYFADNGNNIVRFINAAGIVTTIAGNHIAGYMGDGGPATNARLSWPLATAIDNRGNLFITDQDNDVIRKVNDSGIISTFAGNGTHGYVGDNHLATDAELMGPYGIAIDDTGNLFIADSYNNVIRKVDTFGTITTIAGTGIAGYTGDGELATAAKLNSPISITLNKQGVYIADYSNNVIRKIDIYGVISTVAGNSNSGYSGDGGLAIYAKIDQPLGLAVDRFGNFYFGDVYNFVVRKVDTSHFKEELGSIDKNNSINIYPNPATMKLYFEFPATGKVDIKLMDVTGRVMEEQSVNNVTTTSFNVGAYTPGIYLYQVVTGGKTQTGKVMVGK